MSPIWQGLDLAPAHRRWRFWVAEGRDELPEVRVSSEVIPFRRGRLHQRSLADQRSLELRGYVQETTDLAMREQLDLLKTLLDPERFEPGLLEDDFEDGTHRWIRAVPRNLMPRYAGQGRRLLSIDLQSLDPYWYGAYGIGTLDSGLALDTGRILDGSADIVIAGSGDYVLSNPGSADSQRVRVVINGPSSGPVTVEVTGSQPVGFSFGVALAAGQTLTVDNHDRTVSLATKFKPMTNARKDLSLRPGNEHGEYLRLRPGAQTIRVSGAPATTRINFLPTYS